MAEGGFDARTLQQGKSLFSFYNNVVSNWKIRRGTGGIPMRLTDNFSLVGWGNQADNNYPSAPESYIHFLSTFGCVGINVWYHNNFDKVLFISTDIYSKGPDQSVRGKGLDTLHALHQILQSISYASEFTIYHVATPNKASEKLFTESEGYKKLTTKGLKKILPKSTERWERLVTLSSNHLSRLKIYHPDGISTSQRGQNSSIKLMLQAIGIDISSRL